MKKTTSLTAMATGLALTFSSGLMASGIPDKVMQAYQQGLSGDQAQNQAAVKALKEINKASPHPVVLAMLGSAETAQARYTDKPWEKMQYAERGLARLDRAVKQAQSLAYGVSAQVDVTAACTFAQVPQMMNRAEHANYLLHKVINQHAEFESLPTALKASAYRCASMAARKLDDAKSEQHFNDLAVKPERQEEQGIGG